MSILERGIYRELLDEQWAQGCIRDDDATLSEILDDSQQVLAIAKQVLSKCFTEDFGRHLAEFDALKNSGQKPIKYALIRKIAGSLGAQQS